MKHSLRTLTIGALAAGLIAGSAWGQTTTHYDGAAGAWNNDSWNDVGPTPWDGGAGVAPNDSITTPWEVIIDAGKHPTVLVATPFYTGNLTVEAGAIMEIGQTSVASTLNALGTGNITFKAGSDLTLRYTVNSTHPQNFILDGDMVFAIGRSTSAHHEQRTLTGSISGSGKMTLHDTNNQRLFLKGNNSAWSGGMVTGGTESESKNATIEADVSNSLGTGEILIGDGNTLRIDGADATTGTSSILGMAGNKSANESKKLYMNAADEVGQLKVDGFEYPNGTYGKVGSGADHEMAWIDGNSLLTVSGAPTDSTAPTVTFAAVGAGGSSTDVYVGEPVTVTVTFDEPHTPALTVADVENSSATPISIDSLTEVPEAGGMTLLSYSVVVTPTAVGTLNLRIKSGTVINDLFGNALVVPAADNDTLTVNAPPPIKGELGVWKPWANGGINPATSQPWALGDQYRLAFVTTTKRNTTSTDIDDYNTHVQTAAAGSTAFPDLGNGTWKVIGSTATVTAKANTGTGSGTGVAVLLMDGATTFATSNTDLWNGTALRYTGVYMSVYLDENGVESYNGSVATGSEYSGVQSTDGRVFGNASLTDPKVTTGLTKPNNATRWMKQYNTNLTSLMPFFALSDPLTIQSGAPAGTLIMIK